MHRIKVENTSNGPLSINLYLNAPSDSEQGLSNEKMGHSPQLFTLPRDKETVKDH